MTPLAFGLRSLFTDLVVAQEQSRVTAWASYSTSVSNILSLWAGSFDLPQVLGVPSLTQFQALSILACLSLTATVSICLRTARECNPNFEATLAEHRQPLGLGSVLRSIQQAYHCTPTRIKQSFHGWTDVATLLKSPATQVGSTALLMWTLVSFLSTTVLTRLVRQPCTTTSLTEDIATTDPALCSMHTVWIYSHVLFAACMLLTLVVKSWQGTVVLVSLVGCSWAATQWIPHAIVGAEISPRRKDYRLYDVDSDADADEVDELRKHRGAILGLHNLAISTPQIVAALASSGIMRIMTDMGSVEPAVWTLRAASVPAMVAATLAYRLGEF
ncbi:hypothetical protein FOPE_02593 [Fonsecaea pedrosoi]|nr:hypothetical protein FOPE_02593 [Fonsecaea pedrosoi]